MAKQLQGRLGMTKALKKAARLQGMQGNRKRDKRNQRSSYASAFKKAKGPHPVQPWEHGFTRPPEHVIAAAKAERGEK